jgi:serine/threonine protein kinase
VSLENDKTQIEDITRVEKSEKHTEGITALKTFRGCKVLEELPARGGEADNYILECNGIKAFLKLYRKGLSPKVDLKRLQEISKSYREHLVEIYDTGYDQQTGRYYEIMEYIEHGDLRNLLNQIKGKTIDKKEKIIDKVVSEIAEALNVLHKNNIIHRDLKPANILIRDKDKLDLVLTDFGIARALEEDLSKVQTTGFKGTTHYMAPEELSGYFGKEIDWWHLGVIVYELVFGKHPFEGLTDKVVINALVTKGIEIPQGVPEKYSLLLKGLLTRDYKKRWGYEQVKRWLSGDLNIEVYYEQAETRVEEDYEEKEWMKYGISKETNWRKLGLSPFETKSFIKAGFGFNEAKKWVDAGWRSGELAKRWYNAGFEPEESYVFEKLGLSPKQARQIKNIGLTAYDLKPLVGAEIELIEEFINFIEENTSGQKVPPYLGKTLSFEPLKKLVKELSLWRKEGFTIKEAYEWIKYGFSIQEAKIWKVAKFDPQNAIRWRKLGFNTEEAKEWIKEGFSPEQAQEWKTLNFSPKEAKEWYGVEPNPQNTIKWQKLRFNIKEAKEWIKEGFSPEGAQKWKALNFSPKEAKEWQEEGFTIKKAQKWKALGFSPREAKKWYRTEFDPEEVKIIQELNISLEEAEAWRMKVFSLTEAQEWIKAGFDIESASSWRKEGFSSPWEALEWKEEGFEPQRAKEFVKDGFTPGEAKFIEIIAMVVYSVSIYLFAYYKFRLNSLWLEMFLLFVAYFIGLYFIFPSIESLIRKTIKMFKISSED